MEEALNISIDRAEQGAERHRGNDLKQGVDQHAHDAQCRAACKGLCNAEGDGKDNQADGIVQRDDGQQQIDQRAFGLVLIDDHEGCGRCGGRGYRAQGDGRGNADLIRHEKMQAKQTQIDQQCG